MRRSSVVLVVLALVLATAVTAGASVASTGSSGAVRGVTATSVKVGGLGDAALYAGAEIGAKARFQRANDAGGVNGRTINFVGLRDDGGDTKRDQDEGAKLVATDQVFAVVPTATPDLAAGTTFAKRQVPYFGWALSSNFCSAYGFGFTGCLISASGTSNVWGVLVKRLFGAQGSGKTAAVITESTPSGAYLAKALTAAVKGGGFKVVYTGNTLPVPAGGDYSTLLKPALTSDAGKPASAIFTVGSISTITLVKQTLHDSGYLGVFTDSIEYDPTTVSTASGAVVLLQTAAVETKATNGVMQQLATDVEKVAPGSAITSAVIAGYFSADMFLAALKKAGKKLTAASFRNAANTLTYALANTVGPTKFPSAHTQPTPCGSLVQSDGIAFQVKVPYTCGKVVAVK